MYELDDSNYAEEVSVTEQTVIEPMVEEPVVEPIIEKPEDRYSHGWASGMTRMADLQENEQEELRQRIMAINRGGMSMPPAVESNEMNLNQPEPEFVAPADINDKEEIPSVEDIRRQEAEEVAARVRATNANKVFEAPPNPPPTPVMPPPVTPKQTVNEPMPDLPPRQSFNTDRLYRQPDFSQRQINSVPLPEPKRKKTFEEMDAIMHKRYKGRCYNYALDSKVEDFLLKTTLSGLVEGEDSKPVIKKKKGFLGLG
jgi:hypothetical protein